VALSWGDAPGQRVELLLSGLTSSYRKATFELTATEDATDGRLELLGQGGVFRVGAASLMPADNVKGLRADTLKLLQEVRPPVIRWPGGAFADYYDWRDGVGDRDRRPPRLIWSYDQPALESHDFGLQEFMQLCEILKAQPDLAIKAMTAADAAPAAEAVEYCNGGSETKLGALRGKHGHPQPFGVSWWGVGNESYSYMQADSFTGLHQQLVKAMRAVDPSIKIVAVGGVGVPGISGVGDWTRSMLTRCADQLDMISEHVYGAGDADLWKHANAIRAGILDVVSRHRLLRQGTSDLKPGIGIAFDEWNYDWLGRQEFYGEAGVRYEQRHALGTAAALFALFDSSDLVSMANAHAVNAHGFIKTSATAAAFETTGLVFKLFRNHFGKHPLPLVGSPEKQLDPVGLTAALTADRTALTIGAVNPSTRRYTLTPVIKGATLAAQGQRWTIASTDPLAYNEPGQPPAVQIEEQALAATHTLELPPLSICLYRVGLSWASP